MLVVIPHKSVLGAICTAYPWPFSKGCRKTLRLLSWVMEKYYAPSLIKTIHRRALYKGHVYKIIQVARAL